MCGNSIVPKSPFLGFMPLTLAPPRSNFVRIFMQLLKLLLKFLIYLIDMKIYEKCVCIAADFSNTLLTLFRKSAFFRDRPRNLPWRVSPF
jgi:hypothetical protein